MLEILEDTFRSIRYKILPPYTPLTLILKGEIFRLNDAWKTVPMVAKMPPSTIASYVAASLTSLPSLLFISTSRKLEGALHCVLFLIV